MCATAPWAPEPPPMKLVLTFALVVAISGCIPIGFKAQNLPLAGTAPAPALAAAPVKAGPIGR